MMALAKNTHLTENLQNFLASNEVPSDVASKLAANVAILESVQDKLAQHEDTDVRGAIASAKIPKSIQIRLAEDPSGHVRNKLACNPHLVPEVLRRLAEDQDANVRNALRANPNLNPALELTLDMNDFWESQQKSYVPVEPLKAYKSTLFNW